MQPDLALTVTQLNEYVRKLIATDGYMQGVMLKGEVSGFKNHTSGHWYFTLKDETSRINCVMFRQNTLRVAKPPENGRHVVVSGAPGLFTRDGQYQFYCERLRDEGVLGDAYVQFELLKRKLAAEGLFDPVRKRPIPFLPRRVGVVTSPTGAVRHDIFTVIDRRWPGMEIVLSPAKVQGEGAEADLLRALKLIQRAENVDVILIGRGGGSMEELRAFNDEQLARAIADSTIPVISCVGHETDYTIADFVSDARAATPSAAAEIAVPELNKLRAAANDLISRASGVPVRYIAQYSDKLTALMHSAPFVQPGRVFEPHLERLNRIWRHADDCTNAYLERQNRALDAYARTNAALNPGRVLKRGYAYVKKGGALAGGVNCLSPGDIVDIRFHDGVASAAIRTTEAIQNDV